MKKLRIKVLIFPGGTENGLEIAKSLYHCKETIVYSASSPIPNQALYAYENNFIISDVHNDTWIDELNWVIDHYAIDLIIPANSIVIDAMNDKREKINCDILMPDSKIINITRSKKTTMNVLRTVINCPKVFNSFSEVKKRDLPVFIKPNRGYGGVGTFKVNNLEDLQQIDFENNIVEEFLPGDEYTIDCFSEKNKLLFSGGRKRERIRMGTTMHCEEICKELDREFKLIAEKILSVVPINGFWFFQMKRSDNEELKLQEIDIRVAGTMAYYRCKGINFPLLAIYQHYGYNISFLLNSEKLILDRCLKNTFKLEYRYDVVYIDLDDTIIVKGKINLQVITFIYQCRNNEIKICLLSKNENRDEYLKQLGIYSLFDKIYWLPEDHCKADYIKEENAIYIDDSFSQRQEVALKRNIPTFDPSMVECLIEERML